MCRCKAWEQAGTDSERLLSLGSGLKRIVNEYERAVLAAAWTRLRALFVQVAAEHDQNFGHPLCPWVFDATELPAALDWMDVVVQYRSGGRPRRGDPET